jgi:hypothetical protein
MNEAFGTRERVSMRKPTMFLPALALGVAGAISAAAPAVADPITYTMEFIGTGSLGSSSFNQADVTLKMVNDTSNIIFDPILMLYEINGTATVSVSGVTSTPATFTDVMQVYTDSVNALGGFFDANVGFDVVDLSSAAFSGYQLGAIGPITDTAVLGLPGFTGFPTDAGNLITTGLGDGTTSNATFNATVAAVPAPPIGRGLSVALAVGGMLFGSTKLLRRRFHNPLT